MRELKTVYARVEDLLKSNPFTRDNDLYLQWLYLMSYEGVALPVLPIHRFKELSSVMESVRRCRQKIQNEQHEYPPTSLEIAEKRGWAEEEWRAFFVKGSNP